MQKKSRPFSSNRFLNTSLYLLPGFFVFQVKASDQDGSSPNNVITYSIESGGQDRFRINPDNGTITVSGDIDREQVQSYTLVVVARDRAASPKSNSTRVTIDITDVNDELPTFGDKGDVRVDANETFRGVLYTMSATDADSNSHLQYSILYSESTGQSGTFQTLSSSEIKVSDQHGPSLSIFTREVTSGHEIETQLGHNNFVP